MFINNALLEVAGPDHWIVRRPLVWIGPVGVYGDIGRLEVPAGFDTDLASVPRLVRNLPSFDTTGNSRNPAILHDWLYATGRGGKEYADATFHYALLACGVSRLNAWAFFQGVNWGGWMAYRDHRVARAQAAADGREYPTLLA